MTQRSFFDSFDSAEMTATARQRDPVSSHVAAESYESSGKVESDEAAIVGVINGPALVRDGFPLNGWTGAEIAERLGEGWDSVRVMRRMAALIRKGQVRRGGARECSVKGSAMSTHHPME